MNLVCFPHCEGVRNDDYKSRVRCGEGMTEEEMDSWEQKCMEKDGWFVHYVSESKSEVPPLGLNCHTHGIDDTFDHPNFQVVFPIEPKGCRAIFSILVELLRKGKRFAPGDESDEVLQAEYKVRYGGKGKWSGSTSCNIA